MTLHFDLIFHFHPALPGLALGWFLPDHRRRFLRNSAIVIAGAGLVDAAASLYLDERGAPLDPW